MPPIVPARTTIAATKSASASPEVVVEPPGAKYQTTKPMTAMTRATATPMATERWPAGANRAVIIKVPTAASAVMVC